MNTFTTATESPSATVENILKFFNELKRANEIRATIALAKKEGIVYVGPGIEDAELSEILPGVEIRHVPYMQSGQIVALDTTKFADFHIKEFFY